MINRKPYIKVSLHEIFHGLILKTFKINIGNYNLKKKKIYSIFINKINF